MEKRLGRVFFEGGVGAGDVCFCRMSVEHESEFLSTVNQDR